MVLENSCGSEGEVETSTSGAGPGREAMVLLCYFERWCRDGMGQGHEQVEDAVAGELDCAHEGRVGTENGGICKAATRGQENKAAGGWRRKEI